MFAMVEAVEGKEFLFSRPDLHIKIKLCNETYYVTWNYGSSSNSDILQFPSFRIRHVN